MTGDEIARRTAPTVSGLSAGFMLDAATYVAGSGLGFDGIDFYFAGRAALAGKVADAALPIGAQLFAGWRRMAVPRDPKQAALHRLNVLRELRMARHASAVIATGVDVGDAVRHRSPHMASAIFGWNEAPVPAGLPERWDEAERLTDQASERDYDALTGEEADDFVRLCAAATAAVS